MPTSVLTKTSTPSSKAKAVTHEDLRRVVDALERFAVIPFATVAERKAAFDKLGITPHKGCATFIQSLLRQDWWTGNGWAPPPGYTFSQRNGSEVSGVFNETVVWTLTIPTDFLVPNGIYQVRVLNLIGFGSVANDAFGVKIREDSLVGTSLADAQNTFTNAGREYRYHTYARWTAPAVPPATKTFVATIAREAGTGTVTTVNDDTSFFEVEFRGIDTAYHPSV